MLSLLRKVRIFAAVMCFVALQTSHDEPGNCAGCIHIFLDRIRISATMFRSKSISAHDVHLYLCVVRAFFIFIYRWRCSLYGSGARKFYSDAYSATVVAESSADELLIHCACLRIHELVTVLVIIAMIGKKWLSVLWNKRNANLGCQVQYLNQLELLNNGCYLIVGAGTVIT